MQTGVIKSTGVFVYDSLLFILSLSLLGALTGAITTPLDVIKTRLMVQVWPMFSLHSSLYKQAVVQLTLIFLCRDQETSTKGSLIVFELLLEKKDLLLF